MDEIERLRRENLGLRRSLEALRAAMKRQNEILEDVLVINEEERQVYIESMRVSEREHIYLSLRKAGFGQGVLDAVRIC